MLLAIFYYTRNLTSTGEFSIIKFKIEFRYIKSELKRRNNNIVAVDLTGKVI